MSNLEPKKKQFAARDVLNANASMVTSRTTINHRVHDRISLAKKTVPCKCSILNHALIENQPEWARRHGKFNILCSSLGPWRQAVQNTDSNERWSILSAIVSINCPSEGQKTSPSNTRSGVVPTCARVQRFRCRKSIHKMLMLMTIVPD